MQLYFFSLLYYYYLYMILTNKISIFNLKILYFTLLPPLTCCTPLLPPQLLPPGDHETRLTAEEVSPLVLTAVMLVMFLG